METRNISLALLLSCSVLFVSSCSVIEDKNETDRIRIEEYKNSFTHWAPEPDKVLEPDSRIEIELTGDEFNRNPWQVAWDENGKDFYLLNASDLSIIKYNSSSKDKEEINLNLVPARVADFTRYQDKFIILGEGFIFAGDENKDKTIRVDYSHGSLFRSDDGLVVSNSEWEYIFEVYKDLEKQPERHFRTKRFFSTMGIKPDLIMKNNLWVCKNRTGFWVVTESLAEAVSFRKENIVKSSISNEYLSQVTATNKKIFNSENEDGRINFKYFYEYAWACKDKLFIVGRGKGGFYTYVLNDKCEIISYQKILEEDLYPVDVEYYESENAYRVIILAEDFFSTNGRLIRLSFNKFEEGDVNEVKKTE